jgi:hypothetical protein
MIFSFAGLEIPKMNLKTAQITLGGKSSEKTCFSKNITGGGAYCTPVGYATSSEQSSKLFFQCIAVYDIEYAV